MLRPLGARSVERCSAEGAAVAAAETAAGMTDAGIVETQTDPDAVNHTAQADTTTAQINAKASSHGA